MADTSVEFKKEKFMALLNVTKEYMASSQHTSFLEDDTVIRMRTELWTQTQDWKDIILSPPTFLDWLFKRRKKVLVTARDVLLEPPNLPDKTIRLYEFRPE